MIRPSLGRVRYTQATPAAFYQELMARLRRDRDVRAVAMVDAEPLGGVRQSIMTEDSTGKRELTDLVSADADCLKTIGARLVAGRWVSESDRPGATRVTVVNDTLARERFRGRRAAVGQTIEADGPKTIVGVVHDIRQRGLESMVYDMSVYDPWTFAASAGLLLGVALLASYLPARRAAAIDPVSALRME